MKNKDLRIGIMHSLVGKNDGVSIVIDQTVGAMVDMMGVSLKNIFFLSAQTSPRDNAETNDVFWHKSEANTRIVRDFQSENTEGLEEMIKAEALVAKELIKDWVDRHSIDLIIAHNTSHPYNFITAVGLGYYFEELRRAGLDKPKQMVWWHDSYFERPIFEHPNPVVSKYLKYLPGVLVDGIAFINHSQIALARGVYEKENKSNTDDFLAHNTCVVPNTSDIPWDWETKDWQSMLSVYPEQDVYNKDFFRDVGLLEKLAAQDRTIDDAFFLLQHTRVVPRKRIDLALDLAFALEKKCLSVGFEKSIVVLVSGHSGDEQVAYVDYLEKHYVSLLVQNPQSKVLLVFGENCILSERESVGVRKYYQFSEIPSIIAAQGGIGTFFSEIEGFGNNLLEMMSQGLPVVINKYEVYNTDIASYGFDLPGIDDCQLDDALVQSAFKLLTDTKERNKTVRHNLQVLKDKLGHAVIAEKLTPLFYTIL